MLCELVSVRSAEATHPHPLHAQQLTSLLPPAISPVSSNPSIARIRRTSTTPSMHSSSIIATTARETCSTCMGGVVSAFAIEFEIG